MKIVKKPTTEKELVNLYNTIANVINELDNDFPDYFLEANIMDDQEFFEIITFFKEYYNEVRKLDIIVNEQQNYWEINIEKLT